MRLEYRHGGTWLPVARFDHDAFGPACRNVELVGMHLDVYDSDGERIEKVTCWSPRSANGATGRAEGDLRRHAEGYVERVRGTAVGDDVSAVEEFERLDLERSPGTRQARVEMAAERGEEYDPYEFEEPVSQRVAQAPDPFEDAEPVE